MLRYKLTIRTMSDSGNDEWEIDFDKYEQAKEFAEKTESNKPYVSWLDDDGETVFIFTDKIICMWIDSFEVNDKGDEKWTKGEWIGLIVMLIILGLIGWRFTVNVILPALGK